MGWKGTLRSVAAAARAADRDAQRRNKQLAKARMIDEAAEAVESWENYVGELTSIHTNINSAMDWSILGASPKPVMPDVSKKRQIAAQNQLDKFRPNVLHGLRGGAQKVRSRLEQKFDEAKRLDAKESADALRAYKVLLDEWEEDHRIAQRLREGDPEAMKEVVSEMTSLQDENLIGSQIGFSFQPGIVHAMPEVHSDEIVPKFRRKQSASGRLSESSMPASQFNELYQDYVASVALRVAGDLFNILPMSEVYVTCCIVMLNSANGRKESTPVLSVQFIRETFANLNLNHVDPSDCLSNFNHEMKFSRTKGFSAVKPLLSD